MGSSCSQSICRLEGGGIHKFIKELYVHATKLKPLKSLAAVIRGATKQSTLSITPLPQLSPDGSVFTLKVRLHLNNNDLGFKSITSETKTVRLGSEVPGDMSRLFFSCSDQQGLSWVLTFPVARTLPLTEDPCLSGWTGPRSWSSCSLSDHSVMSVSKRSRDACARARACVCAV